MRDFLLTDGDITIANGSFIFSSGVEAIAQACQLALSLVKGEWFLDTTIGLAYFEEIWVKNPKLPGIRELVRSKLLNIVGVLDVLTIRLNFDPQARHLAINVRCSSDVGEFEVSA